MAGFHSLIKQVLNVYSAVPHAGARARDEQDVIPDLKELSDQQTSMWIKETYQEEVVEREVDVVGESYKLGNNGD